MQANRVGRVAAPAADAPGPGHYRPQHGPTDKHVPAAHIVAVAAAAAASSKPASSDTSAGAQEQQQPEQQRTQQHQALHQHRASTDLPAAAAAGTLAALLVTRGSATGTTPRLDDVEAGPPLGLQPHRVHARPKVQKGTSSFKAVSREQLQRQQRPASAGAGVGGSAAGDGAADYYREGYDSLTRPRSSRGPVAV
jgi:hypothetical protein